MTPSDRRDLRWFWREWLKPVLIAVAVLGSFRSAIADWNDVPSGSMRPTILDGDRIYLNKMAYDLRVPFAGWRVLHRADPERGDIVIFPSPVDGVRLVKRVVGVPGDVVQSIDHRLFVNGEAAQYVEAHPDDLPGVAPAERRMRRFLFERIAGRSHLVAVTPARPGLADFGPIVVPPGRYFMMGDNRDDSFDSRFFGPVPREAIRGRALGVAASVDPDHGYRPRWDRFFEPLK